MDHQAGNLGHVYEWRPASVPADLTTMQGLVSRSWAREKPKVNMHVGDLEWWTVLKKDEPDVISLWFSGDELVGWAWHSPPAQLDVHIHPDHRSGTLYGQMIDWFDASVAARPAASDEVVVCVFEPTPSDEGLLESRGYARTDRAYLHHSRSLDGPIERPTLPDGFTVRPVAGPQDVDRRVAVHRSAFAPSRMTPDRYREAMACPHYRSDLDWVAIAPNGEFASFCNIWLDDGNAVALLEPVGTAERYRRRGMARAVCLAAMKAAAEAGADTAIVLSASENPASTDLYRRLGFEELGRTYRYDRRPG
jgi:ribosomal protein S18 acetylase RimI-like enzyme